jgi:hypothetical protein
MKTEYFMRWPEASASEFFFATIPIVPIAIGIGTRMFFATIPIAIGTQKHKKPQNIF